MLQKNRFVSRFILLIIYTYIHIYIGTVVYVIVYGPMALKIATKLSYTSMTLRFLYTDLLILYLLSLLILLRILFIIIIIFYCDRSKPPPWCSIKYQIFAIRLLGVECRRDDECRIIAHSVRLMGFLRCARVSAAALHLGFALTESVPGDIINCTQWAKK